jgi:alpha-L-rhamnosidase
VNCLVGLLAIGSINARTQAETRPPTNRVDVTAGLPPPEIPGSISVTRSISNRALPTHLQVEYRENPVGLDVPRPRLSWELQAADLDARDLAQTAYQIVVATDPERLAPGQADLWDSGEIEGPSTVLIDYGGRPLQSLEVCHWRVRSRDQDGSWSAWSPPARWTMGLVDGWDAAARWIGAGASFQRGSGSPPPDTAPPDPWFRKVIVLDTAPTRATACIASVGFQELWVNGEKIGEDILVPSVTDNSKRARYLTYEIGDRLRAGTNVIGLWLGTGWSIYPKFATPDKPRAPIALGQIEIAWNGKRSQRVVTDASWKTHASPNTLLGVWDFMHFGGERYDATQELPGWAEATLDDSDWKQAVEYRPRLIVSADGTEPNRERPLGSRSARSISEVEPGVWRVDMGGNFAGTFRAWVEGQPGDRVEFQFSEQPGKSMTHRLRSEYIVGPQGHGEFKNRFNYSVGRWVTIKGLRKKPVSTSFEGRVVRTSYNSASRFSCTDPTLSQIYRTTLETFENLSLGGYLVDCPQRERMGYGGDAHATTTTGLASYGLGAFFTKWAEDWRDAQGRGSSWGPETEGKATAQEPGNLPYTAPTYWGGGGPGWGGYVVHLTHELWRAYGDRRICETMLPTIEAWLAFLETKQKGNILRRWGGEWDFLGDWLWPGATGVNGDTRETLFFNNCYWIYNLQTAAEIAAVLGRQDQARAWNQRAGEVRRAVHQEFYDATRHSYVNGGQAYLAIALVADVPPTELQDGIWHQLEDEILIKRQGHIHAGITGGAFLFKLLMESHRDDLLFTMVRQESYPSWGDMLRQGATTFWESWENNPDLSYLHSSYLYVGAWFIHGVLGIQPEEPGYRRIRIQPGPIDQPSLSSASGSYQSARGPIWVEWTRNDRRFDLATAIPPNTTAVVYLPAHNRETLSMSPGAHFLRMEGKHAVIEVGSGNHHFQSNLE